MSNPIYFVIQNTHAPSIEGATFIESIEQTNWWANSPYTQYINAEDEDAVNDAIEKVGISNVVPVGSIEFINLFCLKHGIQEPVAMNVPAELNISKYTMRKIWYGIAANELHTLPIDCPKGCYLVKPGITPKLFPASAYYPGKDVPKILQGEKNLFVSEMLKQDIVSEWRLFLRHGDIMDQRPYYMRKWVMPARDVCNEMASLLKKYPALTLDVAVLESGETVVIEAHPLLGCGLYGFEGQLLTYMAHLAWQHQCNLTKGEK